MMKGKKERCNRQGEEAPKGTEQNIGGEKKRGGGQKTNKQDKEREITDG